MADGSADGGDDGSDNLGSAASLLEALAHAPGGTAADGPLTPGQVVGGKYEVVRAVGQGGMGVVYLARDQRLARDVALKLGTTVSPAAVRRFEREAHALAQLSHPNVVVIFEVGEVGGRLFVAMEYVPGGTARTWCKGRSPADVIRMFAAAGDGLAAAHAAGIVHRDFKPDNVVIGADGRPRVADFGLAHADGADPGGDEPPTRGAPGTPGYMAPEQRAGETVDARADQYAFCASLWEALFGQRPPSTNPQPPAGARRVPRHVVLALQRGLAADPAARWPAMPPLVAELRRDPGARRRRIAIGALALVAAGSAVAIPLVARRDGPVCTGGDLRLAAIWNPARAAELQRVLGSGVFVIARARLDAFADRWLESEAAACRATRVEGTQSEAILDRRMLCLSAASASFEAVIRSLAEGGPQVQESASEQLATLPDLGACANVAELATQAPPPADPVRRGQIAALTRDLASARIASVTTDAWLTPAVGDALLARARAIGWAPLVARAALARGLAFTQGETAPHLYEALELAVTLALTASTDDVAASAMAELAWRTADDGQVETALRWAHLAEAMWTRTGSGPALGAQIAAALAIATELGPHPADALAIRRRQVDLARAAYPDDALDEAVNHSSLAAGYRAAGDLEHAAEEAATALKLLDAAFGPEHPKQRTFLLDAAKFELERGHLREGEALARRSIAVTEHVYGADHVFMLQPLMFLGGALQARGDLAAAREVTERAAAISRRVNPDGAETGMLEANLATIEAQLGELEPAAATAERGHAILERALGKDSAQLITVLILRGWIARARHEDELSRRWLEHAAALADATPGVDRVNPRIELSYTLVQMNLAEDAVKLLTAVRDLPATPPPAAAELHLALAQAAWAAGDHAGARAEVTLAIAAWTALGADYEAQRADAVAWQQAHR